MEKILKLSSLVNYAENALIDCLDYIANKRIYSTWTQKHAGWQEQWNQSKFTGLYATCNALMLLIHYPDRYSNIILDAIEEMKYMFDCRINYNDLDSDSEEETKRKNRCRLLLEQNIHTTLKAVYFLRTYEALKFKGIEISEDKAFGDIIESIYAQIDSSFNVQTGHYVPALGNSTDVSILTTAQAFILMKDFYGEDSEKTIKTKHLFLHYVDAYINYNKKGQYRILNKFEIYKIKSSFVLALYALSSSVDLLSQEERERLADAFFSSMSDTDIRLGFSIKDSYSVPDTIMARDTYIADSRVLYLNATIQLMKNAIVPLNTIEYFFDDIVEIIDTCREKKQYLAWDSSPSFSHNIRGLTILKMMIDWLKDIENEYVACQISSRIQGGTPRALSPLSVVLFMSFSKDCTESIQDSVQEVLDFIGFDIWWATNDPYDALVVDNILEKLVKAQFAIIDCSDRSANVMYETGWAHGLGKPTLLCGLNNNVFPYEDSTISSTCLFEPNGEINPPPYRDLQKGIANYIIDNIHDFCLTNIQKSKIVDNAQTFIQTYCT